MVCAQFTGLDRRPHPQGVVVIEALPSGLERGAGPAARRCGSCANFPALSADQTRIPWLWLTPSFPAFNCVLTLITAPFSLLARSQRQLRCQNPQHPVVEQNTLLSGYRKADHSLQRLPRAGFESLGTIRSASRLSIRIVGRQALGSRGEEDRGGRCQPSRAGSGGGNTWRVDLTVAPAAIAARPQPGTNDEQREPIFLLTGGHEELRNFRSLPPWSPVRTCNVSLWLVAIFPACSWVLDPHDLVSSCLEFLCVARDLSNAGATTSRDSVRGSAEQASSVSTLAG